MAKQRNPNGAGNYKKKNDGRIEWRQTVDGRTRYLSAYSLNALQEKIKRVSVIPVNVSNKLTVDDWFTKWLAIYIKPLKGKATYDQYEGLYRVHVKPVIGHRKLAKLTSLDIQGVISAMNEKVIKKAVLDKDGNIITPEKKGLSSKTMKETKGVMDRAFKKAIKDKIISENPVKEIEIPKKQTKVRKVLSIDELRKLFDAMKNSRWIWSMRLILVTGIRRGELLALRNTDIDMENRRIVIDESNSSTGLKDTKSATIHYVPLSKMALRYLEGQNKMLEKEYNPILHNEDLKKTGFLFPSENGTMLRADSYTKMVSRFAEKAGIKASPHCLRHTFVFMSRKFLTLKELQYILGHDESTTTLDIYGDMLDDSSSELANSIDTIFGAMEVKIAELEAEKKENACKVIPFRKAK